MGCLGIPGQHPAFRGGQFNDRTLTGHLMEIRFFDPTGQGSLEQRLAARRQDGDVDLMMQ